MELISPRKAKAVDKVAVLCPSFAAPAVAPAFHEQALERLRAITGLVPVEFPTTRKLDASPRERAHDLNAAFADREIRTVLATIGGEDQITVLPHLDATLIANDPKPFLGYGDNTNLLKRRGRLLRRIDTGPAGAVLGSTRSMNSRCVQPF